MATFETTVQVKGLREIDAILSDLPDEVAGPIMKDALNAAGALILQAARNNIHSRTGRTAADLVASVQVDFATRQGVVAVGGTQRGSTGRAHIVRWLEFGTKAYEIKAGDPGRRDIRRATRALRRIGDKKASLSLALRAARGQVRFKRALTLPGGILRASAKIGPRAAQGPLTRALFNNPVTKVFRDELWRQIVRFVQTMPKAA